MNRRSRRILDPAELPDEALLTVGQVARLLNASEKYVRQLLASGDIKSIPWGESRERRVPRWMLKKWQEDSAGEEDRKIQELLHTIPHRRWNPSGRQVLASLMGSDFKKSRCH
jgi:excisionase family DNA binding protein